LDITEFTIAMHLIQSVMSNHISTVPATLPPELFAAASLGSPTASQFSVRRTDSVSSAGSNRAPQLPPKIQQSPVRTDFTGGSQTAPEWDITPQDKVTFDALFKSIDSGNKGYIDGILFLTI
jgi:epidermal growth factor receptor substrate 15